MSWAIWITGVPGSGKSALARAASEELHRLGIPVRVLELDLVRKTLTPSPTYSDAERDVVYRALVYMAALLTDAGVPVIIDATAHRRVWRNLARTEIVRFAEVQLSCPPNVCRERERTRAPGHAPRDIYAAAGRPGATVPGVDVPYEPALAPELQIDTARERVAEGAARIVRLAKNLAPGPSRDHDTTEPGWAIWITGRPGSGKSTLADHVARAVRARGSTPVKVLEMNTLQRFLQLDAPVSESQQEIAHRALAYAAKLLTDAGVAVVVDATAPRRAWRDTARELVARFAEVQLLCPSGICAERERAARWLWSGRHAHTSVPDISTEYEESLGAELTLHTDSQDVWATMAQLMFLVNRLHGVSAPHSPLTARRSLCEFES